MLNCHLDEVGFLFIYKWICVYYFLCNNCNGPIRDLDTLICDSKGPVSELFYVRMWRLKTAKMTLMHNDMDRHITQTNDRLLCIKQVSSFIHSFHIPGLGQLFIKQNNTNMLHMLACMRAHTTHTERDISFSKIEKRYRLNHLSVIPTCFFQAKTVLNTPELATSK